MGEWTPTKLDELIEIKHGFAFKGDFFTDEETDNFLLTPGNFAIGGGFQWGKQKFYKSGPVPEEYILHPGDLLVTMTDLSKQADTLGYSAIVPRSNWRLLHNQRLGKVVLKSNKADKDFLHWLMRSPEYRKEVLASCTGSTVKHTSPKKICDFSFLLPPKEEQRAISSILRSLDDKIELNRRTNETLEETARALFRDWFVDFGPTRAKMAMRGEDPQKDNIPRAPYLAPDLWALFPDRLDDATGLPEGWRSGTVGECFKLTMGQSPPGNTYNDDGEGLPFFQGRTDFGFRYPENRKFCSAPTRVAERDDTLVSVRAPVGDINMAWERCCAGRGIAALRHFSGSRSFTFYSSWAIQGELKQYEHTGTVFGAINKKQFEALAVVDPTAECLEIFEDIAGPLDERIRANVSENRRLAEACDLLLPKLMSGEIRLRDAEKITGEAVT